MWQASVKAPELSDLTAAQKMHARPAVLAAGDVVATLGEVEHVPPQRAELAGT